MNSLLSVLILAAFVIIVLKASHTESFVAFQRSKLAEPPTLSTASVDTPIVFFEHANQRGRTWTVKEREEQLVVEFDANGNAAFYLRSIQIQPGFKLYFRMYKGRANVNSSSNSPPKEISAFPRAGLIDDVDAYLQEDSYTKYDHVFGYNPGVITDAYVTVRYQRMK